MTGACLTEAPSTRATTRLHARVAVRESGSRIRAKWTNRLLKEDRKEVQREGRKGQNLMDLALVIWLNVTNSLSETYRERLQSRSHRQRMRVSQSSRKGPIQKKTKHGRCLDALTSKIACDAVRNGFF